MFRHVLIFYTFFVFIRYYIHRLGLFYCNLCLLILFFITGMLAYSFLFKSIPFCSFIILLTLILYHGEYAGLVYSFLFYIFTLVMFFLSTLVLVHSVQHYVLNDSFLFCPALFC